LASTINLLMCVVKNGLSLCCSSVCFYISIRRGFKENGSRQKTKQMAGSLVLDPLVGYTRKVKHQTGIFQITTLVHLQDTVNWSMYESSATTDHSLLTHGISPTILFQRCQPSGIGDNQERPAGVNLKRYHCILNISTNCH
jgi:hypothetical protein